MATVGVKVFIILIWCVYCDAALFMSTLY